MLRRRTFGQIPTSQVQPCGFIDLWPPEPSGHPPARFKTLVFDHGWEKLFSEHMCRHFWEDFRVTARVARYHNVYGPHRTYDGGREKAPAAIKSQIATGIRGRNLRNPFLFPLTRAICFSRRTSASGPAVGLVPLDLTGYRVSIEMAFEKAIRELPGEAETA